MDCAHSTPTGVCPKRPAEPRCAAFAASPVKHAKLLGLAALSRTARPTEPDALLPPSVPVMAPKACVSLGCLENPVTVPSAFEPGPEEPTHSGDIHVLSSCPPGGPRPRALAFGSGFFQHQPSACSLASFLLSLPDLEVSIDRGVWKMKSKAKTGLFVFKRQHTLVEIIAKDKWGGAEERKSEIE